jgi:peptidoglycan/xylan/chitin deacetylase (PgdA/CDA1 family)
MRLLLSVAATVILVAQPGVVREVAVTFDDLPASRLEGTPAELDRLTRDLLAVVRQHGVPAVGFVNEDKLFAGTALQADRVTILRQWVEAGIELGNHTYSHADLHRTTLDDFERDVLKGEKITRDLAKVSGQRFRYFRHPYLHTGLSLQTKLAFETFLKQHGYTVAPVTIDNYEYVFAAAFDRAAAADRPRIRAAYLDYMASVVAYYEDQSRALLGRELRQVLLLHANALNAQAFGDLAAQLKGRGYRFITLERALEDPAYALEDTFTGSGGITWLHRWALTQKKPSAFFAGEPVVPDWISRAAGTQ